MTTQTARRNAHPADGLYYTTIARLREVVSNSGGDFERLRRALKRYGEETPIPITQTLMRRLRRTRCSQLFFVPLDSMLEQGLVTEAEEEAFRRAFYAADYISLEEAQAFMDMLLARAKREGRA